MLKKEIAEKISAIINTNAEAPQLSQRTIDDTLETLIPLKGEEETVDDFVKRFTPVFQTMAGNVRKDVSDFAKTLEESKKKEEKKEPEKKTEPKKDEKDDQPEYVKQILDELKELKNWKNEQDGKKTVEEVKTSLVAEAKKVYPENVINVASMNFDFSKENADKSFQEALSFAAKNMGIKPETGEPEKPDNYLDFVERQKKNLGIN